VRRSIDRERNAPVADVVSWTERELPMLGSWWLFWLFFMFLFLVPPVGYGWGYRGWGPPYPRFIQRRRARQAATKGIATHDHHAWGWGGDLVWMVLLIGMFWAGFGIWWR
jgi:hypothetical protein